MRPLEERFPPPPADIPAPAGIIVLGGAVDTEKSEARGQVSLTPDGGPDDHSVSNWRGAILPRGSSSLADRRSLRGEGPPEAISARKLWLSLGVPDERMIFEAKSRNTWENAVFTRDLVKPKPGETWLLVTSAWHMPRSVGIFRHVGFDVIPYPVAYRTFGDERDFLLPTSVIDKVIMLDFSVREWIGLLAYRLAGKTDALFPAP